MQVVHLLASATQGVDPTATGQLVDVCVAAASFAVAFGPINEKVRISMNVSILFSLNEINLIHL
jgi:hypothetical protein